MKVKREKTRRESGAGGRSSSAGVTGAMLVELLATLAAASPNMPSQVLSVIRAVRGHPHPGLKATQSCTVPPG